MPSRNTRKSAEPGSFHVYNRGRKGAPIFRDDADRDKFKDLLVSHLSAVAHFDSRGRPVKSLRDEVSLVAMCLMTTHFHLVLWQRVPRGMERLMRSVLVAYTSYFNRRHGTSGSLFAGEYRARQLEDAKDFMWAVGYVHDNHASGLDYRYSTHGRYLRADHSASWLDVEASLSVFGGRAAYRRYMQKRADRAALDDELRN